MKFGSLREISKAYTEGIYADTPANRKLGRVGMTYADYSAKTKGESGEKKEEKVDVTHFNIKNYKTIPTKANLKRASLNDLIEAKTICLSQISNSKNDMNNQNVPFSKRSEHVARTKDDIRRGNALIKTLDDIMLERGKKKTENSEKEIIPSYHLDDFLFDSSDGSLKEVSSDEITDIILSGEKNKIEFTDYKNTYLAEKKYVKGAEPRVVFYKINKKEKQ